MHLFKTVLFAADFSESSREAFRVGCSLAGQDESRILVIHILEAMRTQVDSTDFGPKTLRISSADRDPIYRESVKERLRRTYVPDRAIEVEYRVSDGSPTEEILHTAATIGCDLIVMGTHGRTGLSRILTGSVAEAVLRAARCPVLALRSPDRGEVSVRDVQAILAPIDGSENAGQAVRVARTLARDLGARLVLLRVAPLEIVPAEIPMPIDLRPYEESLEGWRMLLDGPDLKSPIEVVLTQGEVAAEILNVAERKRCDLIVMGTHGRSGFSRLLLGSVAEAVLRRSNEPILAVKLGAPVVRSTGEALLDPAEDSTDRKGITQYT